MPPTDIQRRILVRVVRRFLEKFGESTTRQDLLIEFQSVNDLDDLLYRHLLKAYVPGGEDYLPTALAFHYCGDAQVEDRARKAAQLLAKVLRGQFLSRKVKLSREGLEEDGRAIDPSCDLETIELGIYLGAQLNLFQSFSGGNQQQPIITPIRISEQIVELTEPDGFWDDWMAKWRPWPSQDASGGVIDAALPPAEGASHLAANPSVPERRWSRADKLTALGILVAIAAAVISFTVPEVRRIFRLPSDEPTPAHVMQNQDSAQAAKGSDSKAQPPVAPPSSEPAPKDWIVGDWSHTETTTVAPGYTLSGAPSGCIYNEQSTDELVVSRAAKITATLSVSVKRSPGSGDCTNAIPNTACERSYDARVVPTADSNIWSIDAVPAKDSCEEHPPSFSGSLTRLSDVEVRFDSPILHVQEVLSRTTL